MSNKKRFINSTARLEDMSPKERAAWMGWINDGIPFHVGMGYEQPIRLVKAIEPIGICSTANTPQYSYRLVANDGETVRVVRDD